jgi:putative ABC transport system permease protein
MPGPPFPPGSERYRAIRAPAKYLDADRLVDVSRRQLTGRRFLGGASHPDLADWRAQAATVAEFGVHRYTHEVNVAGDAGAEEAMGHRVSANLFGLLGAYPIVGHSLDSAADRSSGPRQALIGYSWWMRRFGGDAEVIGKTIRVNGEAVTIAGVMPRGFTFPPMGSASFRPVLWMSLNTPVEQLQNRGSHSLSVIARLHPDASLRQAQTELDTIAARLADAFPREDGDWGIKVSRLNDVRQLDEARPALLLLMAAAALVLLIACANIANLLLARAFGRDREMAMRRALGATWQRLARQVLTESGLLAVTGGAVGILLAYLALPLLQAALPVGMPRADEIAVNGPVLCFAAGVAPLTGLLFGLLPALRWGEDTHGGLAGRTASARNRATRVLVTAEIAIAVVLLTGAGLMVESFRRVANVVLGFRAENVLTMRLQLTKNRYPDGAQVASFRTELLRRTQALPGVTYVGTVSSLPMGSVMQGTEFEIDGRPETASEKPFLDFSSVSGDYIHAMGIPLIRGRYFDSRDRAGSPPVVLISEAAARAQWPDGDALGSRIRFDDTWFTIAGIVKDIQQYSPERGARGGTIYALNEHLPLAAQGKDIGRWVVLVVRTTGAAATPMGEAMRRVVADLDKDQSAADVTAMEHVVRRTLDGRRLHTLLLALFAGLAILLAAVGIFGVTSYAVARRTKEIGIRVALGATRRSVLLLVGKETLLLASLGAVIGVGGSIVTSRFLATFLYGVSPTEPPILSGVALVMVAIVVVSGMLPARRAMRVDPMVALREE